MLGRFLEYSVATPDLAASFEFYSKLGFTQADARDVWPHPYVVVTDGRIAIGLHGNPDLPPQITFVRPQLLKLIDALDDMRIKLEFRRLGNNEFNEIGLRDPSGHLVRILEAGTFSPAQSASVASSSCGEFREIALPSADADSAKVFWERLGFVGMDEESADLPHVCCVSDTVDIGLYAPAQMSAPALLFEIDDGSAAARTRKLVAPEGTRLWIQSSPTD